MTDTNVPAPDGIHGASITDEGDLESIDEPTQVGGRIIFPNGKEVDAETGETILDENGRFVGPEVDTKSVVTDELYNKSEEKRTVRVDDDTGEYVAASPDGEISRFTDSGTDAIQAAIGDLPSDGGTVLIQKGRYDIADPTFSKTHIEIPASKSNVTLVGGGFGSEIYLPDNTTETDKGKLIIHVFGDGCTLANFAINGNQDNQGNIDDLADGHNIKALGDNFTMRGVKSYNSPGDGVELETDSTPVTKNHTITNCIFHNNQEQDCHFHGVKNAVFDGNVCTGVHQDGSIAFWADVADNENIVVSDNVIIVDPNDGLQGVYIGGTDTSIISRDIKIHDNHIENGTRGIDIDGRYCEDVEITNNTVKHTRVDADIWIDGGTDIRVRRNTCKESQETGIRVFDGATSLQNVWVENNTVQNVNRGDNSTDAVGVDATGNEIDNVFVRDNDIFCDSSPFMRRALRFQENTASTYGEIHCTGNWVKGTDYQKIFQQYPVVRHSNEGFNDALGIEPTTKWVGLEVRSDGSGWDPDSDGNAEDVRWTGSSWTEVVDYGGTLDNRQ